MNKFRSPPHSIDQSKSKISLSKNFKIWLKNSSVEEQMKIETNSEGYIKKRYI